MKSLLGELRGKIKGKQEDFVSESLTYILNESEEARQVMNKIIKHDTGLEFTDLTYYTQETGEERERPDISGLDRDTETKEVLLIEAKFWAELTWHQPNSYIKRLGKNTVLMFLVPGKRKRKIYKEVKAKIEENFKGDVELDDKHYKIIFKKEKKHVLIKSWQEILDSIKPKLKPKKDQNLISDIDQIIGLCNSIDNDSFQQITDKDLFRNTAKRFKKHITDFKKYITYKAIVDKVIKKIKKKHKLEGLWKGADYHDNHDNQGYTGYFYWGELGLGLDLNTYYWANHSDTSPFWLYIALIDKKKNWEKDSKKEDNWINPPDFKKKCKTIARKLDLTFEKKEEYSYISLNPKHSVVDDLVEQIEAIYKELRKSKETKNKTLSKKTSKKDESKKEKNQVTGNDFSSSTANRFNEHITDFKRYIEYKTIVDEVIKKIKKKSKVEGLPRSGTDYHDYGYIKYFYWGELGLGLDLNTYYWDKYPGTSPFWLYIAWIDKKKNWKKDSEKEENWINPPEFKKKCKAIARQLDLTFEKEEEYSYISLKLKLGVSREEVIDDLVNQIEAIYEKLKNYKEPQKLKGKTPSKKASKK